MSSFISYEVPFLGKDFLVDQRLRNMQISKKRRRKHRLKSYAKISQKNSKNLCIIVEVCLSPKILTMVTSSACLKAAWRDTNSIQELLTSFGIRTDLLSRKKLSRDRWWAYSRKKDQRRTQKLQKVAPMLETDWILINLDCMTNIKKCADCSISQYLNYWIDLYVLGSTYHYSYEQKYFNL